MARPARALWITRTYARRRHRTWMLSMTLATVGWSSWWLALFLMRFAPDWRPSFGALSVFSGLFAAAGLLVALVTVRAQRSWLLFVAIPIFANLSLLLLPWLVRELELRPVQL